VLINLLADLLLLAGRCPAGLGRCHGIAAPAGVSLRQLVVATPLDQVSRAQIEHTARSALAGNFFTVNLDTAQAAFERMPWVRSASLRRLWPDGVELELEEHRAAARWTPQDGEARLVSTRGEVFLPHARSAAGLCRARGFGTAGAGALSGIQREPGAIGRKPVVVHLSAREAWQIEAGRRRGAGTGPRPAQASAGRTPGPLHGHYPAVSNAARNRLQAVGVVDMRYPNGFALRAGKS
jgi:cell division protein FtsQ